MIYFDKIEVVNRLNKDYAFETIKNYTINYDRTWIFDKIHHEINQFCSKHTLQDVYINEFDRLDESLVQALQSDIQKWAPGIESKYKFNILVIAVRVTKPRIPENIRSNYEQMESEKTKFLITIERQKVLEKEAETTQKQNIIKAQSEAEVSKIVKGKEINEHESKRRIQEIENTIYLEKQKTFTDAEYYKISKEIEANNKKLTPEYLKYVSIMSVTNNTKFYFGESIPKYLTTNVMSDSYSYKEQLPNK